MALKKISKIAALAMAAVMASEAGLTSFVPLTAEAKERETAVMEEAVNASGDQDNFTWDNATVYFVLTDRFYNGDKSNDHSYGRSKDEVDADKYETRVGTFHGGDLAGMTQKIEDGYFDDLGVNAIWISAPYEQIHGAMCATGYKHYPYHGYWPLDFSNMDANMGTEDDMKKFVDTAHEHGIRIVLDVVMNHVGYADPVTANEYGFGKLSDNWQDVYYKTSESSYQWYHDYSSETQDGKSTMVADGDWVSNWWGPNWVRALGKRLNGYEGVENQGDEVTYCSDGLPDIKTENSSDPGLPKILENKWKKEGRYDTEMAELKQFFQDNSLQARQVNYVVKWLTDFVTDYGVDGFRCDTAKHIEKEHWGTLSKCATKALKEWREKEKKNNPDNPAAYWDEDFWTTGEVFGHGVTKDDYFSTGGFDSLINFSFQGNEGKTGEALESIYSGYASQINNDASFNVLSYISSHDTSLGARSANAGTALLLCPGGVQIFYGDETGRRAGGGDGKQPTRSHMNWDSIDTKIQSNWQKVGQFRRKHASVGAGQHKKLSGDAYTFSRTYHLGEADEDKVVISLPAKSGTYNVSVGDVFADGETVTDAYSGQTYTVSSGQVSATCDDNGVILLEGSGEIKPSVGANISEGTHSGTTYSSETIKVKLGANKVKDATYSINGGKEVSYNADDVITLGAGTAYGEKTVLVLKGKSEEDNSEVTKTVTYEKCKEPAVSDGVFSVKVLKSEFSTAPNIYVYTGQGEAAKKYAGAWPGTAMKDDGEYWTYTNEEIDGSASIIVNCADGWRSTEDQQEGLVAEGSQLLHKDTKKLEALPSGKPAKVTVKYVDEAGNDITDGLNVYRVGVVGAPYTTSAREVQGFTLKTTPENATGKFTEDEITVTYVYSGGAVPTKAEDPTPTPSPSAEPTKPGDPTPTSSLEPTKPGDPTPTPSPSAEPTKPGDPTPAPQKFTLDGFTAVKTSNGIRLIANASGDSEGIRYMFSYEKDGKEVLIVNFQPESQYIWTPAAAGTYKLNVYAVNKGVILDKTVESYTVK